MKKGVPPTLAGRLFYLTSPAGHSPAHATYQAGTTAPLNFVRMKSFTGWL